MRLASGLDSERLNARSRAYNNGKVTTASDYVYVNGKPITCRRCKRKRLNSEAPEHLQFKTCNPCRIIERAQKRRGTKSTLFRNKEEYDVLQKLRLLEEGDGFDSDHVVLSQDASPSATASSHPDGPFGSIGAIGGSSDDVLHRLHDEFEKSSQMMQNNSGNSQSFGGNPLLQNSLHPQQKYMMQQQMLQKQYFNKFSVDRIASADSAIPQTSIPGADGAVSYSIMNHENSLIDDTNGSQFEKSQSESQSGVSTPQVKHTISQCLGCGRDTGVGNEGTGLCVDCFRKESVIRSFDYFLGILKVNSNQELRNVILAENIAVQELLKTSANKDQSSASVILKLYERYIIPISSATGFDFKFQNQDGFNDKYKGKSPLVIREHLKCVNDIDMLFKNDDIDSELMALQNSPTDGYIAEKQCDSLLALFYNTDSGQMVISFSHKPHSH